MKFGTSSVVLLNFKKNAYFFNFKKCRKVKTVFYQHTFHREMYVINCRYDFVVNEKIQFQAMCINMSKI